MSTLVRTQDTTLLVANTLSTGSNKVVFDSTDEGASADPTQNIFITKFGPSIDFTGSEKITLWTRMETICTDVTPSLNTTSNTGKLSMAIVDNSGRSFVLVKPAVETSPNNELTLVEWIIADFTDDSGSGDLSDISAIRIKFEAVCAGGANYRGMIATWNLDLISAVVTPPQ